MDGSTPVITSLRIDYTKKNVINGHYTSLPAKNHIQEEIFFLHCTRCMWIINSTKQKECSKVHIGITINLSTFPLKKYLTCACIWNGMILLSILCSFTIKKLYNWHQSWGQQSKFNISPWLQTDYDYCLLQQLAIEP